MSWVEIRENEPREFSHEITSAERAVFAVCRLNGTFCAGFLCRTKPSLCVDTFTKVHGVSFAGLDTQAGSKSSESKRPNS